MGDGYARVSLVLTRGNRFTRRGILYRSSHLVLVTVKCYSNARSGATHSEQAHPERSNSLYVQAYGLSASLQLSTSWCSLTHRGVLGRDFLSINENEVE